ncbi:MAG: response regulator [Lachnospiraceae bacterium]|nr:response regulator [Lachnospiraceae bacterium]
MYQFLISVLFFTIIGLFAVCVISLTRWGSMLHTYLFFYSVSNLVYNCAYVLILRSQNEDTYVTALKIGYLGRVWVGISMTLFIAELCGKNFPKIAKVIASIINMIVYLFILNLERTHIYYKQYKFVMDGDIPTLPHSGGPLYYVFSLLNLFYSILCVYIIVSAFIHEKNKTAKKRNLMLVIAVAVMVISYLVYFLKLIPLARKFDLMIFGYALCTALMLIAIIKYEMLDTIAAAKNYVVDELSESIIVVDTDERVSYFNKPAKTLFPELVEVKEAGSTIQKLSDELNYALKSGEPLRMGESIYTPRVNPLMEDGTRVGTLYSLSDDSEHYRYMDELREQKRIADNANEAKSKFLANMSHEIRTPINAVLGFNEMISRECARARDIDEAKSPAVTEAFDNISSYSGNIGGAGSNLLSIINAILDLSKIEAGKMDLVEGKYSLRALLKDINRMLIFRAAEKGLEFTADVEETLPDNLFGDMIRIRQVVINILTNAVKYTQKGSVRLIVKGPESKTVKKGDMLTLTIMVKDTGIGIRPEDREKLFGTFERLELERNSTIEGTGLGLAISRQLISMMGGKITVESEYGSGSTFIITLPQKVVSDEPIGKFSVSADTSERKDKPYEASFKAPDATVLVVDDTKLNLTVAKALLKDTGLKVDTVDSGSAAIELTMEKKYDLILMDQRMPNMDGTEALKNIRSQENGLNTDTPIICMTADAIIGSKERYIAEGFDDYLSKPVKINELEQTLIKHLPPEKITKQ